MNALEKLQFGFTYSTSAGTTAGWIWSIIVLLVFTLGFGSLWGRMWNRSWSLTSSGLRLTCITLAGLLAAYATLNLCNVLRFDQWLENERSQLVRSVTSSGKLNRDVLSKSWDRISPESDQKGLSSPDEGGEEIRLNDKTDAAKLAATAAEETSAVLRKKTPFIWGVPFSPMLTEEVAPATLDAVALPDNEYPAIVTANNDWTRTAATIQANHSLDAFSKMIKPETDSLKFGCLILLCVLSLLMLVMIPFKALGEIQVNPKG